MAIIWLRWRRIFFREFVAAEEAGHILDLDRGVTSRADFLVPAGQHRADWRRNRQRGCGRLRGRWRRRGFLVLPSPTVSKEDEDDEDDGDQDRGDEGDRGLPGQGERRGRRRMGAERILDIDSKDQIG